MKAPDKIYIHTKTNPLEITWSEVREGNATNEEYVRKDMLVEWAEYVKKNWYNRPGSDEVYGACSVLEALLDKLNSI